jgi:GNAT superfamily N-acetyltransferase
MIKIFKNNSGNTFSFSKNRILRIVLRPTKEQLYVPIPFGINPSSYDSLDYVGNEIVLTSSEKSKNDFFQKIKLPLKPKSFNTIFKNKKYEYYMSFMYDILDLKTALEILHEEHYILNEPLGIPIAIKSRNLENFKTSVCGVIYLSKLTYGNPSGRLRYFDEEASLRNTDPKVYASKHIGFIDRIAIHQDHQGIGVSTHCLRKIDSFLYGMFINKQLTHLEVMTSWALSDFKSKSWAEGANSLDEVNFLEKNDMFCRAGFKRMDESKLTNNKSSTNTRQDKGRKDRMDRKYRDPKRSIKSRREKVIRYYYIISLNHGKS